MEAITSDRITNENGTYILKEIYMPNSSEILSAERFFDSKDREYLTKYYQNDNFTDLSIYQEVKYSNNDSFEQYTQLYKYGIDIQYQFKDCYSCIEKFNSDKQFIEGKYFGDTDFKNSLKSVNITYLDSNAYRKNIATENGLYFVEEYVNDKPTICKRYSDSELQKLDYTVKYEYDEDGSHREYCVFEDYFEMDETLSSIEYYDLNGRYVARETYKDKFFKNLLAKIYFYEENGNDVTKTITDGSYIACNIHKDKENLCFYEENSCGVRKDIAVDKYENIDYKSMIETRIIAKDGSYLEKSITHYFKDDNFEELILTQEWITDNTETFEGHYNIIYKIK